jgi:serine phosphatase RsbU (regulator of sigma subunit)
MAAAQSFLEASLDRDEPLERTAAALNRYINARVGMGEFLTLWLARIDPASGLGTYIDAGHGYAMLVGETGEVRTLAEGGGTVIGIDPDSPYEPAQFVLDATARVVVCSDGLPEQADPAGRQFGVAGLREVIARKRQDDLAELLRSAVRDHAGRDQLDDDLTIMVVSREA